MVSLRGRSPVLVWLAALALFFTLWSGASPTTETALAGPVQQQAGIWVLRAGYPQVDPAKVAVPSGHTVNLGATSGTVHKQGTASQGAYDWTFSFNYPAPPAQLVPDQTLTITGSAAMAVNAGQAVLEFGSDSYLMRLMTEGFISASNRLPQPYTASAQVGRVCITAGCLIHRDASAKLTVVVPPPVPGQLLKYTVWLGASGVGSLYNNPRVVEYVYEAQVPPTPTPLPLATAEVPTPEAIPTDVPPAEEPPVDTSVPPPTEVPTPAVDQQVLDLCTTHVVQDGGLAPDDEQVPGLVATCYADATAYGDTAEAQLAADLANASVDLAPVQVDCLHQWVRAQARQDAARTWPDAPDLSGYPALLAAAHDGCAALPADPTTG
jgi:hypothetical protein